MQNKPEYVKRVKLCVEESYIDNPDVTLDLRKPLPLSEWIIHDFKTIKYLTEYLWRSISNAEFFKDARVLFCYYLFLKT